MEPIEALAILAAIAALVLYILLRKEQRRSERLRQAAARLEIDIAHMGALMRHGDEIVTAQRMCRNVHGRLIEIIGFGRDTAEAEDNALHQQELRELTAATSTTRVVATRGTYALRYARDSYVRERGADQGNYFSS